MEWVGGRLTDTYLTVSTEEAADARRLGIARHPVPVGNGRDPARFRPDPAARAGFEQLYATTYGAPPRELTSLAFDAGGIARAAWDGRGFPPAAMVRQEGFLGADGLLGLLPDGGVRRGLAIFEIDPGGSRIVQPAPQTFDTSGV